VCTGGEAGGHSGPRADRWASLACGLRGVPAGAAVVPRTGQTRAPRLQRLVARSAGQLGRRMSLCGDMGAASGTDTRSLAVLLPGTEDRCMRVCEARTARLRASEGFYIVVHRYADAAARRPVGGSRPSSSCYYGSIRVYTPTLACDSLISRRHRYTRCDSSRHRVRPSAAASCVVTLSPRALPASSGWATGSPDHRSVLGLCPLAVLSSVLACGSLPVPIVPSRPKRRRRAAPATLAPHPILADDIASVHRSS